MVIAGIIGDNDNLFPGMATGLSQFFKKSEKRLCVEFIFFPAIDKLAIAKTDTTKVANTSAGWFME
jgi:hypothetical protein